jgi:hypothetical protein
MNPVWIFANCFEEAGVTDAGYSSTEKVRFGETPKVRAGQALHARRVRYLERFAMARAPSVRAGLA